MATWIFQANPDRFDIDGYLSQQSERITWLVNQSQHQILQGDQVFLWRARGSGKYGPPGIIAECRVDSPVQNIPDEPEALPFWRDKSDDPSIPHLRVWLRVIRVADNSSMLTKDQLVIHPLLENVGPIAFANATNYEVKDDQGRELNLLWARASLPRRLLAIEEEVEGEARSLGTSSLEELLAKYEAAQRKKTKDPRRFEASAVVFERDPLVIAIARKRASYRCEIPECSTPSFVVANGERYCEVHHIQPLAEGGADTIDNVACLCANHHREVHLGNKNNELRALLLQIRSRPT
jgi:5-methylcytosine-specific restriction endonuclease McrA